MYCASYVQAQKILRDINETKTLNTMPEVKVYTIQQLMEIAATGGCAPAVDENGAAACADQTKTALVDPSKFKKVHTRRARFSVQNKSRDKDLWFGMGESMQEPGLSLRYPGSIFVPDEGVNDGNFYVGGLGIALGAGAQALALQLFQQWNKQSVITAITLVRVAESDPIMANNLYYETLAALNGKCEASQVGPECNSCAGTTASNLITARFPVGLAGADDKNAWGIRIPKQVDPEVTATIYTIDVDYAFVVGSYGYVEATGSTCG